MKPVINLDELEIEHCGEGVYRQSYGVVSDRIGARKLGYNLTVVPPGCRAGYFHNHRVGEEMFMVLSGEGMLRFGEQDYPLRAGDVIACPPGGREVAHQISNTGSSELKLFALGTREPQEVVEFPDSDKVMVACGPEFNRDLRLIFKAGQTVSYHEGE